ncbi:MAG TPA: hypothetical protein HA367_04065 [Candidatus Methanofastidiosum sp.]|nr:hypothetical protein [Methanofastidiosum sp.]
MKDKEKIITEQEIEISDFVGNPNKKTFGKRLVEDNSGEKNEITLEAGNYHITNNSYLREYSEEDPLDKDDHPIESSNNLNEIQKELEVQMENERIDADKELEKRGGVSIESILKKKRNL